jgi:hydrogenase maturation protease
MNHEPKAMNLEPSIVVIGLGDPLRGDDGLGWYAVDRLAETFHSKDIEFLKYRELLPEVSEKISRAEYVLFVDASVKSQATEQKGKGGAIDEMKIVPSENNSSLETHKLDPAGLLAFSSALYGKAPEAIMLMARGESFEYHEGISKGVQRAAQLLVNRACEIANNWLEELWSAPLKQ